MPATALLSSEFPVGSDLYGDLGYNDPTHAICLAAKKMGFPGWTCFVIFYAIDRYHDWNQYPESGPHNYCAGDSAMMIDFNIYEFHEPIYKYVLKLCHDPNLAETITADAFAAVIEKLSVGNISNVRSYLYQTAYHKVVDRSREDKHFAPLEIAVGEVNLFHESGVDFPDFQEWVKRQLTQREYKVFALRVFEGMNVAETAEIMDMTRNNVRQRFHRARKKLMRAYAEEGITVELAKPARAVELGKPIRTIRRKPKNITLNKRALKGRWAERGRFDWMLTVQEFLIAFGYPDDLTGTAEKFLRNYHRQLLWLAREKGLLKNEEQSKS